MATISNKCNLIDEMRILSIKWSKIKKHPDFLNEKRKAFHLVIAEFSAFNLVFQSIP